MMYADSIAKELQQLKTELGNLWSAEIINSGSDETNGNGGGRIRYIIPATPCDVEYEVKISNHNTPGPKLDKGGVPIPGEEITQDTVDALIIVTINGNPVDVKVFKNQPSTNLNTLVKDTVLSAIKNYHAKDKNHQI